MMDWSSGDITEGFALETHDGLIFTVKGQLHPPDAYLAYLRYVPDADGDRRRRGVVYRRVYAFADQERLLQAAGAVYLAEDPVLNIRVQRVPLERIAVVHDPVRRLEEMASQGAADELEAAVLDLAALLARAAELPAGTLGISGSLLVGTHHEASDIDLVVYGAAAGSQAHAALAGLLADPDGELCRLDPVELAALHRQHAPDTPLSLDEFARAQRRKVNEALFRGRSVFVRFVRRPEEAGERYGERRYRPLNTLVLEATVSDASEAIYSPCRYELAAVRVLAGEAPDERIRQIVSHRGRFSDQARQGERVQARGRLEQVWPRGGRPFLQCIVGGQVGDWLRVVAAGPEYQEREME